MTITDGALTSGKRIGEWVITVATIETAWNDDERYRMIVRDLPRRFHSSSRDRQTYALGAAPRLTGTKWDVLLAAVAEHIAIIHNHRFPTGATKPERFLDIPWLPAKLGGLDMARSWIDSPGAFIRHGVLPDPLDLNARGGRASLWLPSLDPISQRDCGSLLPNCDAMESRRTFTLLAAPLCLWLLTGAG